MATPQPRSRSLPAAALLAALLAAAGIALPAPAAAFSARHGAQVNPVDETVFEVVPRIGKGWDIWCAAGDYARRALKAPWKARIYVARGRGPSVTTGRRSAVHFTLDPAARGIAPVGIGSPNEFAAGNNMTVRQAFDQCMGNLMMN